MGGKPTRKVYDFHMSMDYGFCHGPVDAFNKIWIKDKPIWCGSARSNQTVTIDLPDLFGGDDKEGGPVGKVELYNGSFTQVSSDQLASRVGRTSATMPGYRGICHAFFRGNGSSDGFRWTSNNPYLPAMKANITRIPTTLNNTTALVWPIIGFGEDGSLIRAEGFLDTGNEISNGGVNDFPAFRDEMPFPDHDTYKPLAINLYDFGITREEIDVLKPGKFPIIVGVQWDFHLQEGGENIDSLLDIEVGFWSERAEPFDFTLSPDLGIETFSTSGRGEFNILQKFGDRVPIGTQWVTVRAMFWSPESTFPDIAKDFRRVLVTNGDLIEGGGSFAAFPAPIQAFDVDEPSWIDLEGMFPREVIDSGLVTVTANWELLVTTAIGGDNNTTTDLAISFFQPKDPYPDPVPPETTVPPEDAVDLAEEVLVPGGSSVLTYAPTGPAVSDLSVTVPPGARFMGIRGEVAVLFPLSAVTQYNVKSTTITGPAIDYAHCVPDSDLGTLPDANPAHIIHECLVNEEWGDGQLPSRIDASSFETAAQTLYDEGFGLSLIWVEQDKIKAIIQEILDHIQAVLFLHPETGLWTLKLLRNDYDVGTLETLDPTNCDARNRKRRAWGETINQIDVEYTDPETEKGAVVTAHDNGNITMQGRVNSDKRSYYAVRNPYLGQILADRDVTESATPLFSCQIKVDRSQWKITPGSLKKFSWPEDGIEDMIVRIMDVDYGTPKDRQITLSVSEDIFAFEQTRYDSPQGTLWTAGEALPQPLDHEMAYTTPLPMLVRGGLTVAEVDAEYPAVGVTLIGTEDDPPRPIDIAISAPGITASGDPTDERVAIIDPTYSEPLPAALVPAVTSELPGDLVASLFPAGGVGGDFLLIGSSEAAHELVMLETYNSGTGMWTVVRGLWDTVPLAWPDNSRIWAIPDGIDGVDQVQRAAGESINYSFLPRTSLGRLELSEATPVTYTANERPYLPFRPANCEIDGNGFEVTEYMEAGSQPANLELTWKNRNRTLEDQLPLSWDDASTVVETGQTTVIRVYDGQGDFVVEVTGLTGESYTFPVATLAGTLIGEFEFLSERDGLRSFTGARRAFNMSVSGYGYSYGFNYGGVDGYGWDYGNQYGS